MIKKEYDIKKYYNVNESKIYFDYIRNFSISTGRRGSHLSQPGSSMLVRIQLLSRIRDKVLLQPPCGEEGSHLSKLGLFTPSWQKTTQFTK